MALLALQYRMAAGSFEMCAPGRWLLEQGPLRLDHSSHWAVLASDVLVIAHVNPLTLWLTPRSVVSLDEAGVSESIGDQVTFVVNAPASATALTFVAESA